MLGIYIFLIFSLAYVSQARTLNTTVTSIMHLTEITSFGWSDNGWFQAMYETQQNGLKLLVIEYKYYSKNLDNASLGQYQCETFIENYQFLERKLTIDLSSPDFKRVNITRGGRYAIVVANCQLQPLNMKIELDMVNSRNDHLSTFEHPLQPFYIITAIIYLVLFLIIVHFIVMQALTYRNMFIGFMSAVPVVLHLVSAGIGLISYQPDSYFAIEHYKWYEITVLGLPRAISEAMTYVILYLMAAGVSVLQKSPFRRRMPLSLPEEEQYRRKLREETHRHAERLRQLEREIEHEQTRADDVQNNANNNNNAHDHANAGFNTARLDHLQQEWSRIVEEDDERQRVRRRAWHFQNEYRIKRWICILMFVILWVGTKMLQFNYPEMYWGFTIVLVFAFVFMVYRKSRTHQKALSEIEQTIKKNWDLMNIYAIRAKEERIRAEQIEQERIRQERQESRQIRQITQKDLQKQQQKRAQKEMVFDMILERAQQKYLWKQTNAGIIDANKSGQNLEDEKEEEKLLWTFQQQFNLFPNQAPKQIAQSIKQVIDIQKKIIQHLDKSEKSDRKKVQKVLKKTGIDVDLTQQHHKQQQTLQQQQKQQFNLNNPDQNNIASAESEGITQVIQLSGDREIHNETPKNGPKHITDQKQKQKTTSTSHDKDKEQQRLIQKRIRHNIKRNQQNKEIDDLIEKLHRVLGITNDDKPVDNRAEEIETILKAQLLKEYYQKQPYLQQIPQFQSSSSSSSSSQTSKASPLLRAFPGIPLKSFVDESELVPFDIYKHQQKYINEENQRNSNSTLASDGTFAISRRNSRQRNGRLNGQQQQRANQIQTTRVEFRFPYNRTIFHAVKLLVIRALHLKWQYFMILQAIALVIVAAFTGIRFLIYLLVPSYEIGAHLVIEESINLILILMMILVYIIQSARGASGVWNKILSESEIQIALEDEEDREERIANRNRIQRERLRLENRRMSPVRINNNTQSNNNNNSIIGGNRRRREEIIIEGEEEEEEVQVKTAKIQLIQIIIITETIRLEDKEEVRASVKVEV
ncbi:MAG: hypothetical protein EZS28_017682 [Streblomastix strix]|uniref:Uncharacterized protein n=1 Tax=Streblomastix strix TaxID=222440 RepID=A0A5J4VVT1_9EUKA|nr:MAG: hypothetical protein EZS28_017682 [Streblomastix strix]